MDVGIEIGCIVYVGLCGKIYKLDKREGYYIYYFFYCYKINKFLVIIYNVFIKF